MAPRRDSAARARRAVWLRVVAGKSYQEIADTLWPCPVHAPNGLATCSLCGPLYRTHTGALKAVRSHLNDELPMPSGEQRAAYVQEQNAALRELASRAMRDALNPQASIAERSRANAAAVRALQRQARLLGLDAPTVVQIDDALTAEIQALADELTSGG